MKPRQLKKKLPVRPFGSTKSAKTSGSGDSGALSEFAAKLRGKLHELNTRGIMDVQRTLRSALDKKSITARTVASAFTPPVVPPHAGWGKGLKVGDSTVVREPLFSATGQKVAKDRRKLVFVSRNKTAAITVGRPSRKEWNIESLTDSDSKSRISSEKLAEHYRKNQYKTDIDLIKQHAPSYGYTGDARDISDGQLSGKVGGIPLIRFPKK